jgi:hypothetical protein
MNPILITGNNVVAGSNNSQYTYQFPFSAARFQDHEIALGSLAIYYSWQNIEARFNNQTFQYRWIDGTTHTITIPESHYDVPDLNSYFQSVMLGNGHYLVDDTGDNVFYLELVANEVYYALVINAYAVPTTLPSGWTRPSTVTLPVGTARTPQFIVQANGFRDILGLEAGTYPAAAQATTFSQRSTKTPQLNPVQSVIIQCSLLRNDFANPSTNLFSFSTQGVSYGSIIDVRPIQFAFCPVPDGQVTEFTVTFCDQNLTPLRILDSNLVLTLYIRKKSNA